MVQLLADCPEIHGMGDYVDIVRYHQFVVVDRLLEPERTFQPETLGQHLPRLLLPMLSVALVN